MFYWYVHIIHVLAKHYYWVWVFFSHNGCTAFQFNSCRYYRVRKLLLKMHWNWHQRKDIGSFFRLSRPLIRKAIQVLTILFLSWYTQNIHLVAKWLAKLEKLLEQFSDGSSDAYRVYISAEPAGTPSAHIIPQGILESSIKITNEPPTGMLANLHKALDNFNQV